LEELTDGRLSLRSCHMISKIRLNHQRIFFTPSPLDPPA